MNSLEIAEIDFNQIEQLPEDLSGLTFRKIPSQ